ncbi:hypothetical protein [Pseudomonas abietaniphila]
MVDELYASLRTTADYSIARIQAASLQQNSRSDMGIVLTLLNNSSIDIQNAPSAGVQYIVDLRFGGEVERRPDPQQHVFGPRSLVDGERLARSYFNSTWQQLACVLIPCGGCSQRNTAYHTDHLPMAPCPPAFFTFDHTECPPLKRKDSLRPAGYFYKSKWISFCAANSQLNVVQFLQRYPHCCFSEKTVGTINPEQRRFEACPARSDSMPAS